MVNRRYGLPELPPKKDRGWTTGMGVTALQNHQLTINVHRRWADADLLNEMRAEFPLNLGRIFTADLKERHVRLRALRTLFNRGAHGNAAPDVPSKEYPATSPQGHSAGSSRSRSGQVRP